MQHEQLPPAEQLEPGAAPHPDDSHYFSSTEPVWDRDKLLGANNPDKPGYDPNVVEGSFTENTPTQHALGEPTEAAPAATPHTIDPGSGTPYFGTTSERPRTTTSLADTFVGKEEPVPQLDPNDPADGLTRRPDGQLASVPEASRNVPVADQSAGAVAVGVTVNRPAAAGTIYRGAPVASPGTVYGGRPLGTSQRSSVRR